MSSLAAEFAARMRKQVVDAHGESTPSSEGLSDKCSRLSSPEEEAQKSPTVIVVDSPEQVPFGEPRPGCSSGGLCNAGGSYNANQVVVEAPSEVAADSSFLARLSMAGLRRARMSDRIVLSSFVQLIEWDRPSVDTPALGPEVAQSIIGR